MTHRHELTDEQWARLEPLLPLPKRGFAPRDRRRGVGAKGSRSPKARCAVRRCGMPPVSATKADRPPQRHFDRELYRERTRVERRIKRLKQDRRVTTRYEKLAVTFLAMGTIAAILIWL